MKRTYVIRQATSPRVIDKAEGFSRFLNSNGGTGTTTITTGGETYSYDPVLSYDMGCSIMDEMGDGIEPNKNCDRKGNSGIPGMNVSSIRYLNGKIV